MSNEVKKEAKGKRAEFQKAKPAMEGKTTVINVARTTKVVKGGKRMGFRALVVVGNGQGKVGVAIGKANQVQAAIAKAETHARKHMITFPIVGDTIPHEVIGKFGAASVWMKPCNLVYATMEAFKQLKSKETVNVLRGKAEKVEAAQEAPKAEETTEAKAA